MVDVKKNKEEPDVAGSVNEAEQTALAALAKIATGTSVQCVFRGSKVTVHSKGSPYDLLNALKAADPGLVTDSKLFHAKSFGKGETKVAPVLMLSLERRGDKFALEAMCTIGGENTKVSIWHDPEKDRDVVKILAGLSLAAEEQVKVDALVAGDRKDAVVLMPIGASWFVEFNESREGKKFGNNVKLGDPASEKDTQNA